MERVLQKTVFLLLSCGWRNGRNCEMLFAWSWQKCNGYAREYLCLEGDVKKGFFQLTGFRLLSCGMRNDRKCKDFPSRCWNVALLAFNGGSFWTERCDDSGVRRQTSQFSSTLTKRDFFQTFPPTTVRMLLKKANPRRDVVLYCVSRHKGLCVRYILSKNDIVWRHKTRSIMRSAGLLSVLSP